VKRLLARGPLLALLVLVVLPSEVASGSSTFPVTNTNDSGAGSLRAAIDAANASGAAATITFDIPGSGGHVIGITSASLPKITVPITINGRSQPGFAGQPLIQVDNQKPGFALIGLEDSAGSSKILALSITRFDVGIQLENGGGNKLAGCSIGLGVAGDAAGNAMGVVIQNQSANNVVGGTSAADRNTFTANGSALRLDGPGVTDTVVSGNFVGRNSLQGTAYANQIGIELWSGASNNTIGGTSLSAANVVVRNSGDGIDLVFSGTSGNVIEGDYVGVEPPGPPHLGLAGGPGNGGDGISISGGANGNTIGGTTTSARNFIARNGGNGISLLGGARNNLIEGNDIGTTGRFALPNAGSGISLTGGATRNTIGGTDAGAGNLISGNGVDGVTISGSGTTGNAVQGNLIGTDATGSFGIRNQNAGVAIESAAASNTIGGTTAAARNVISGNWNAEVLLTDSGTSSNLVEGNYLGVDATGTVPVASSVPGPPFVQYNGAGAVIASSASGNRIGGTSGGARNVISGNLPGSGVVIDHAGIGNVVEGDYVGTDASGSRPLLNGDGVQVVDSAGGALIGGTAAGAGNVVSGNNWAGVAVDNSTGVRIQGNLIGTDATGKLPLGNGAAPLLKLVGGVAVDGGATLTTIGGTTAAAANTIAFNASGVSVGQANGNAVLGNSIFRNYTSGIFLGSGANDGQPTPSIADLVAGSTTTTLTVSLAGGQASASYRFEAFANPFCDPSGAGEGKTLLATKTVAADSSGNVQTTIKVPNQASGTAIAVTATDVGKNDTSRFSNCSFAP